MFFVAILKMIRLVKQNLFIFTIRMHVVPQKDEGVVYACFGNCSGL
jgi:hypothetical protein